MRPLDFGNSVYCQSVPLEEVEEAAVSTLDRFFEGLPLRGIFNAEFVLDERTGPFEGGLTPVTPARRNVPDANARVLVGGPLCFFVLELV